MAKIQKDLGPSLAKLRARRAYLGWTQTELAEKAHTSKQTVCEVENGSQRPNRSTLFALCDSLSLPSSERDKLFRAFGHSSVTRLDPIGLHIRALRVHAGFTQSEMAEKVGLTRAAISKAEMGRSVVTAVAPLIYDFFGIAGTARLYENNEHQEAENLGNPVPEGQ